MAIATFYHPSLSINDTRVTLSEDESAHATRSKRLKLGAEIQVLNGRGAIAQAIISSVDKRATEVELLDIEQSAKSAEQVVIATALPKGDRQKFMVDMLCQLGVNKIVPLHCDHSVTRFTDKVASKWRRYAIEACKQSQNPWLPVISEAVSCVEFLNDLTQSDAHLFYADGQGGSLNNKGFSPAVRAIMIGPEGGFSSAENQLFELNTVKPVKLTDYILRTETAAVAAASLALI